MLIRQPFQPLPWIAVGMAVGAVVANLIDHGTMSYMEGRGVVAAVGAGLGGSLVCFVFAFWCEFDDDDREPPDDLGGAT